MGAECAADGMETEMSFPDNGNLMGVRSDLCGQISERPDHCWIRVQSEHFEENDLIAC